MRRLFSITLILSLIVSMLSPNVYAQVTQISGVWTAATGASDSYITENSNEVIFNIPNAKDDGKGSGKVKWKAENRTEIDYVLDTPVSEGNITVSFEFKANEALGAQARVAEIRFTDSADNADDYLMSVVGAVNQPYIFQASDYEKFTTDVLSSGTGDNDEWHTAIYEFYGDGQVLTATRATIDGEDVNGEFSYTKNADITSIKAIEFWFFGNSTDTDDYQLKIKNMNITSGVEELTPVPKLVLTGGISNGEDGVIPSEIKFGIEASDGADFNIPKSSFDASQIKLFDKNSNEVTGINADFENKTISIDISSCSANTFYTLKIGKNVVEGEGGECLVDDYSFGFTTSSKKAVKGTWSKTWSNNQSTITEDDGIITIEVKNPGTQGTQNTRDSYTYSFDEVITGTNVPVKISYKYKASESLLASESNIRFYPYADGSKGGTSIAVDFPFTKPEIRWTGGVVFNLPAGVESLSANEWHEVEYLIIVDSTNGITAINTVIDGASTDYSYVKNSTQLGCVDFWIYSNATNTDDYKLEIKDFEVVKGADIITVTSNVQDGSIDVEPKNMQITFSMPVTITGEIKEAINITDENNLVINSEKYTVSMNSDNTSVLITMNTDDLDSKKTYKIHLDNTKIFGKRYETIGNEMFISFTLPEIEPKATLGIFPRIPDNSSNITPVNMVFDIIPLANDRISDVSGYDIRASSNINMNDAVKIFNEDLSEAEQVILDIELAEDNKSVDITLKNYDRYKTYIIKFLKSSFIGENGELMSQDYEYSFSTGEIDEPPYNEYSKTFKVTWQGKTSYITDENTGITTFTYKNSEAQGDTNQRTEMGWYLDTPISNSEGPLIVSYDFQFNDALLNTTDIQSFNAYVSNSNASASLTHRGPAKIGDITDWSKYIVPSSVGSLSSGVSDSDVWHNVRYIMDVDNGKITNSFVQIDGSEMVNISALNSSVNNIGLLQMRFYSHPNSDGVYEDYILRVKNVSIKSVGALKGNVTVNSPTDIGLRFSYDMPMLFADDFEIQEKVGTEYKKIKQSYVIGEMSSSDMKQINITIGNGGLCYNTDYRIKVKKNDLSVNEYIKLKQTDIDFRTKEYPDNAEAQISGVAQNGNLLSFNCKISNISTDLIMNGAYVIVAVYDINGNMCDNYATVLPQLNSGQEHLLNNITLTADSPSKIKVFIFEDDNDFNLYHYPQVFAVE